jgi:hypothetical protein
MSYENREAQLARELDEAADRLGILQWEMGYANKIIVGLEAECDRLRAENAALKEESGDLTSELGSKAIAFDRMFGELLALRANPPKPAAIIEMINGDIHGYENEQDAQNAWDDEVGESVHIFPVTKWIWHPATEPKP